jgi:hypothetical protein
LDFHVPWQEVAAGEANPRAKADFLMTIRLYATVKDQGLVKVAELGRRLDELAICCRGLEFAIDDFCADADNESAKMLSNLARRLAEQTERLAQAVAAEAHDPLN